MESTLTLIGSEKLRGISVERDYGTLPAVSCNPGQINQVFLNLLTNAAEAIDGDGRIRISTQHRDHHVTVRVADSGRGIPADRLTRIFDFSFSRGDKRVKLGSGLSSAYNIIQRHNGRIDVASAVGKGTTVTLTLPVGSVRRDRSNAR